MTIEHHTSNKQLNRLIDDNIGTYVLKMTCRKRKEISYFYQKSKENRKELFYTSPLSNIKRAYNLLNDSIVVENNFINQIRS